MSLSRLYALVLGAVYLLVGLVGFAVAPGLEPMPLVIFDINLVHVVLGIAGKADARDGSRGRRLPPGSRP